MTAYYNENDHKAAAWLRELIKADLIAPGDVDERSIEDVEPNDLKPYTQCHFFAGIGVWSYALRSAQWPDSRPVWSGSCPCQPFSAAGKRAGFDDERHLWPAWHYLIEQCRPEHVFGEQVASKDGLGWFDLVQTDLEGAGYTVGAVDLCAAGVGAPHIRQRLWFVAERMEYANSQRQRETRNSVTGQRVSERCSDSGMGNTVNLRLERHAGHGNASGQPGRIKTNEDISTTTAGRDNWLADPAIERYDRWRAGETGGESEAQQRPERLYETVPANPVNGFWRNADWLYCGDGKWRAVEPGTFPLVDGATARVGRLRGYGNALNAEVAKVFIESYLEVQ